MNYQAKNTGTKTKIGISLALIMVLFLGCASQREADLRASGPKRITNVTISKKYESLILTIEGKPALIYTSEKLAFPMGVVLKFPDTHLELPRRIYLPPDNEIISSIKADEKIKDRTTTARIFIAFKKDTPYDLSADAGRLTVTFPATGTLSDDVQPGSKAVEKKPEPIPEPKPQPEPEKKPQPEIVQYRRTAANNLKAVTATPLKDKITVEVKADAAINDYKSFILYRPPRIVFDLYDLKSPYKQQQTVSVASPLIKRIRHYGHPNKVRLVLETHENYLSKYTARASDTGLLIHVGDNSTTPDKTRQTTAKAAPGTIQAKLAWEEVPGADAIKNLRPGVTYYFVVTTVKGSRESRESEELPYTPGQ
jgi:hypothetical protein